GSRRRRHGPVHALSADGHRAQDSAWRIAGDAAIIEPLACAIHTVNRGDLQLDDVVVIAGAGPLGLMMTQVAHLKTPKKLVVIDLVEERLALAREYGADVTINPKQEDALAIIHSLTDGYGCDVYIETTGAPIGVNQGMEMIR